MEVEDKYGFILGNNIFINMANTYRWYIYEMETIQDFNGFTNFVCKIRWRYNATNENGITADIVDQTTYNHRSENPYVEYNDISESITIQWLEETVDLVSLQTKLDNIINEKTNPSVVTLPLPWN